MTLKSNSGNAGRPLAAEVAIIGAGPIGLMTANLLGFAGIRVLVLERNAGLLGLPRAIAYDAETLRLFSQVGLFDDIAPGLIQDPHVRHQNARNVTLMAADFPRGLYGHSSLGTFYQPDFERALLKGLAQFPSVRVAFGHEAIDLIQNAKGVTLAVATPSGATTVEADYVVACDGGASPTRERLGVRLVGSTYSERASSSFVGLCEGCVSSRRAQSLRPCAPSRPGKSAAHSLTRGAGAERPNRETVITRRSVATKPARPSARLGLSRGDAPKGPSDFDQRPPRIARLQSINQSDQVGTD